MADELACADCGRPTPCEALVACPLGSNYALLCGLCRALRSSTHVEVTDGRLTIGHDDVLRPF